MDILANSDGMKLYQLAISQLVIGGSWGFWNLLGNCNIPLPCIWNHLHEPNVPRCELRLLWICPASEQSSAPCPFFPSQLSPISWEYGCPKIFLIDLWTTPSNIFQYSSGRSSKCSTYCCSFRSRLVDQAYWLWRIRVCGLCRYCNTIWYRCVVNRSA